MACSFGSSAFRIGSSCFACLRVRCNCFSLTISLCCRAFGICAYDVDTNGVDTKDTQKANARAILRGFMIPLLIWLGCSGSWVKDLLLTLPFAAGTKKALA